jgi:DNA-directed RNA polymerase specialized sigma24 family protein
MADCASGKERTPTMTPILGEGLQLLIARLGSDPVQAEGKYQTLRSRLVKLMECNGIQDASDLADEALLRVARKLAGGEPIRNLEAFTVGVAKLVRLEAFHEKPLASFDDETAGLTLSTDDIPEKQMIEEVEASLHERKLACMRECFDKTLSTEERDFMSNYVLVRGGKNHAMRKRAQRIRERLQQCVRDCEKAK